MNHRTVLVPFIAFLLTVGIGSSAPALARTAFPRNDPLAGVYHPWRLQVLKPDITVSGTVDRVKTEPDHDWHVNVRLNKSYEYLINSENSRYEGGDLVVEVIPMDQQHIPRPHVGEHVTITGAYVSDKDHGWREIHPAWMINGRGTAHYTPAAAAESVAIGIRGNEAYFGRNSRGQESRGQSHSSPHVAIKPTGATGQPAALSFIASDLNVWPGDDAMVEIHTKPGATATIQVDYLSGPSRAKGLYPQHADASGDITWTWKVGTRTTPGKWPVWISAAGKTMETYVHVN